jgi:hypothetical protein
LAIIALRRIGLYITLAKAESKPDPITFYFERKFSIEVISLLSFLFLAIWALWIGYFHLFLLIAGLFVFFITSFIIRYLFLKELKMSRTKIEMTRSQSDLSLRRLQYKRLCALLITTASILCVVILVGTGLLRLGVGLSIIASMLIALAVLVFYFTASFYKSR